MNLQARRLFTSQRHRVNQECPIENTNVGDGRVDTLQDRHRGPRGFSWICSSLDCSPRERAAKEPREAVRDSCSLLRAKKRKIKKNRWDLDTRQISASCSQSFILTQINKTNKQNYVISSTVHSATYLVDTLSFHSTFSAPTNTTLFTYRAKNCGKDPATPFNVACLIRKITAICGTTSFGVGRGGERTS